MLNRMSFSKILFKNKLLQPNNGYSFYFAQRLLQHCNYFIIFSFLFIFYRYFAKQFTKKTPSNSRNKTNLVQEITFKKSLPKFEGENQMIDPNKIWKSLFFTATVFLFFIFYCIIL